LKLSKGTGEMGIFKSNVVVLVGASRGIAK